ncbi:cytochrome P450 2U1-like [Centruroides vittatus]|uniref:cytochrome P450 2U1-like n=1 Tax=Centruroides vittatus TaxID=120091 RepID=UPI00351081EA
MKNAFLGRPPNAPNHVIQETVSFSVCSGYIWREQKRFALHAFRNLGFGKHKMEDHIKEELSFFLKTLEDHGDEAFNVRPYLSASTSNNISALMFGRRMHYDDPKRVLLNKVVDDLLRFFRPTGYHAFFPRLRSLLFRYELLGYKDVNFTIKEMLKFIDEEIKYHRKTLDADNVRDYVDSYLLEMEKKKESKNTSFSIPMLRGNISSLFGAGGSTIRTTLEWSLLTMAGYPDIQKKIHAEIDEVVGKEKTPSWMDHSSMPYTEAVLMEVQRWKTVVPVNLVRYGLRDETVQGYYIPKGTIVFANLWEVHHDSRYWDNPDKFIAERFLSEDGRTVIKHPCYMPFTIGKRSCPGESLAVMEVFLYFTTILQKFDILPPKGEVINFDAALGIIYEPLPYKLRFILRN